VSIDVRNWRFSPVRPVRWLGKDRRRSGRAVGIVSQARLAPKVTID